MGEETIKAPEVWMRGPVEGVPPLLQPVAHALLQAVEEIEELMHDFPDALLWEKPAGLAAPAFHLLHLTGVLDRLSTYARKESLTEAQLAYLKEEPVARPLSTAALVASFKAQVARTVDQLKATDESTLTEFRPVGRKALPSTVIGLLFHAAEHTMRHGGQLLVTVKGIKMNGKMGKCADVQVR